MILYFRVCTVFTAGPNIKWDVFGQSRCLGPGRLHHAATARVLGAYLFVNRLESEVFTAINKIVQSYKFGIEIRVHVE